MITVFSIPKPFVGHTNVIQRNAIRSWKASGFDDIVLIGDDHGVAAVAEEHGVGHVPAVEKNEFGTPLLSSAFAAAARVAKHDMLMYVNADIILFPQLIDAVRTVGLPRFLLSGRRWNLDLDTEIDFSRDRWADDLQQQVSRWGVLHGYSGKDYFVFTRNTVRMPAFAVGRPGWDDWLIYDVRHRGIPVIDATPAVTIVHQNHDYSHSQFGQTQRVGGPELKTNVDVAGGLFNMMTLRNADWVLDRTGLRRPALLLRIHSILSLYLPWRMLFGVIRTVRNRGIA